LEVTETVALEYDKDPQQQEQILETPQVLGVEKIKVDDLCVWIKTHAQAMDRREVSKLHSTKPV